MRDLFEAAIDWWHRVTVPQLRHEHQAEPIEHDDPDSISSSGCLPPVGAFDEGEGADAEPVFEFDPQPPDCC